MKTQLNPYISFQGNAREAMEFYRSVFGGELNVSTYADYQMAENPQDANKVMHAHLDGANGISFMGADTPSSGQYQPGSNFSMTLNGDNEAELTELYNKLSAGGTILEPLMKAPWGDTFGMFTDKFGIPWMVNISGTPA